MKQFLKFVPAQLTIFLILGILTGSYFNFQPTLLVAICSFLILSLSIQYVRSKKQFYPSIIFAVLSFLIFFFIGISSVSYKSQLNLQKHYANSSKFTESKFTSSIVKIKKILKPNLFYNKYEAEVLQLNKSKTIGKVLINIKKDSSERLLKVDDNLLVKAVFETINPPLNPFGFNYKKYLKNQQIHYQIRVQSSQFLILDNKNVTLKGIAAKIRVKINESLINNGFKNDELAVINALLLGQRNSIKKELLESYSGAGAVHILAVSGLHVGIILLLLMAVFKPLHYLKHGKLIATLLIVMLLWVYAIIAGLSASVVRAVAMFTALTVGMQLVQRSNVYSTLVISMFFLLLFNPFYLFEVGFQLSYLAVFSIVWIQPKLYNLWIPKFWLATKLWQLLTVSIAAQVGVLPLILFYFHQFPGLFFLSNLVIIPFLGLILSAGIITIILSVFEILPQFLGYSYSFVIQQMNNFVAWISNQDFFIIQHISFSIILMFAFYALIFISFKWIEKGFFYRLVLLLISVVLIQSIVIFEKYSLQTSSEFIVLNKSKTSILLKRIGTDLSIYTSENINKHDYIIKPYLIETGVGEGSQISKRNDFFKFKDETILVVDSLGIYEFSTLKPSVVLLQHSPKINLNRLLNKLQPKIVIADGSNYKSYVKRWKLTCLKNKTPFYSTMQKGAYVLK